MKLSLKQNGQVNMTSLKTPALFLLLLAASAVAPAQQKFPLRPGEWTATVPSLRPGVPPTTILYCMNDETWAKTLAGKPSCTLKNLTLGPTGGSYSVDCSSAQMQMNGDFKVVFDGMTHMTSSGTMKITLNGNTNQMTSSADFRWKGATCDPAVDMNLRNHNVPPPSH